MCEVTAWFQVDPFVQMGWQPMVVCSAGFFCAVGGSFCANTIDGGCVVG
jgi:hypothetical protein